MNATTTWSACELRQQKDYNVKKLTLMAIEL